MATPDRTYALVVGAEQYRMGGSWDLDGPACDALAFIAWLTRRNVPSSNIYAFISPLDANKIKVEQRLAELGIQHRDAAERGPIHRTLAETVPGLDGDLLFIFWGGHGIATQAQDRRLFYADAKAANKENLEVNSLLSMLRSTSMRGLREQVIFVDACANYFADMGSPVGLPMSGFPQADPSPGYAQYVLFAAASGEVAINNTVRRSGAFSQALMDAIKHDERGVWPPDPNGLIAAVQTHFRRLRDDGKTRQTPVYLISVDAKGNERPEGRPPPAREVLRAVRDSGTALAHLQAVVEALLECSSVHDRANRDALCADLPSAARARLVREEQPTDDLLRIVSAAFGEPGGVASLLDSLARLEARTAPTSDGGFAIARVRERALRVLMVAGARAALEDVAISHAILRHRYFKCVPDSQRAPSPSDLDAVLDALDQMAPRRLGVPALVEFMERINREHSSPSLQAWLKDNVSSTTLADLRQALDADDRIAALPEEILLVEVHTADDPRQPGVPEPTELESWLYHDREWGHHQVESCATTEKDTRTAGGGGGRSDRERLLAAGERVRVAFSSIMARAQGIAGPDMAVEFLLPRKLFWLTPERWPIGTDYTEPVALGVTHPVVLRWRERLRDADNARAGFWHSRAAQIKERVDAHVSLRVRCVLPGEDVATLRADLQNQSDFVDFVALLFVPPDIPANITRDLLVAALVSGAPYAFWLEAEPSDREGFKQSLERLAEVVDVARIPWYVRNLRSRGEPQDAEFARLLSVVWDNPQHTPTKPRLAAPA